MLAPIILFAFNRIEALKNLIISLSKNKEAQLSDLYIFVDGPRSNVPNEKETVYEVQNYITTIKGFNTVQYFFSKNNKGLGPSIIEGVSLIINKYKKAIILEDDLIVSTNFLSFMNQGLNFYETQKKVFSICGYSNKIKKPHNYKFDS